MGLFSSIKKVASEGFLGVAPYLLTKEGESPDAPALPEYYEDPDYREAQDLLKSLGKDLIEGNIPDYYAPIGEYGSAELEKYLGDLKGDIEGAGLSAGAATGRRGGSVAAGISEATGEATNRVRYADYLRAMEGRKGLLDTGINVETGVRSAGQVEGANKNRFNLGIYDRQYNDYLRELDEDAQEDAMFGDILGTVASAGIGFAVGGPAGALTAASGFDWSSILSGGNPAVKGSPTVGGDKSKNIQLGRLKSSDLRLDDYKRYL